MYNLKRSLLFSKMDLIKSFLTGGLNDCSKVVYASLNEGDKAHKC